MTMSLVFYMYLQCHCVWCLRVSSMSLCLVFTCIFNDNVFGLYVYLQCHCVWCLRVSSMSLCLVFTCIFNDNVFGLYVYLQ